MKYLYALLLTTLAFSLPSEKPKPIYKDGEFINEEETKSGFQTGFWTVISESISGDQIRTPTQKLKVSQTPLKQVFPQDTIGISTTWIGHSSFAIELDGLRLLLDPVFTEDLSPVPWLLSIPRFQENTPISVADIDSVDVILISHDHYDHLDKEAILELAHKTSYIFTPLKVGDRLIEWGVDTAKVVQMTWWNSMSWTTPSGHPISLTFTPTRHFSGRGLGDRNTTLWGSWAIKGKYHNIYFSGDSGYSKFFKNIGHHLGPFDLTFIENGQYNKNWPKKHMFPQESLQAHLDVKGKVMMPIHWGSFNLSHHNWWDPITTTKKLADSLGIQLVTPKVGQTFRISKEKPTPLPQDEWWKPYVQADLKTLED